LSESNKRVPKQPVDAKGREEKIEDKKKPAGHRPGDIGRALRSVYDETLRESVPDDFKDLLGKLS
jgi:hypothetical protein